MSGSSGTANPHPSLTSVIVFSAEDDSGVLFGQRTINNGSSRKLGPLEIVNDRIQYEGGLIGLLPQEGTRQ
jgi:hypothetical protein